jgi:hypothetical protein
MRSADPSALAALVTLERPRTQEPGSLGWQTFRLTRFPGHVPLSGWGRWCGVHKPTILRWVAGRTLALGPRIAQWMGERGQAEPSGLSLAWTAAAGAQRSAPRAQHRWVTGLCLPGAGSEGPLGSVSSPAGGDPVAQAVRRDRCGDRRTQAGDAARVADRCEAHSSAVPGAAAGASGPCWLTFDSQCYLPLLLGLRAVLQNPPGGSRRAQGKRARLPLLIVYLFTQHALTGQAPIEVIVTGARRMPL